MPLKFSGSITRDMKKVGKGLRGKERTMGSTQAPLRGQGKRRIEGKGGERIAREGGSWEAEARVKEKLLSFHGDEREGTG